MAVDIIEQTIGRLRELDITITTVPGLMPLFHVIAISVADPDLLNTCSHASGGELIGPSFPRPGESGGSPVSGPSGGGGSAGRATDQPAGGDSTAARHGGT